MEVLKTVIKVQGTLTDDSLQLKHRETLKESCVKDERCILAMSLQVEVHEGPTLPFLGLW